MHKSILLTLCLFLGISSVQANDYIQLKDLKTSWMVKQSHDAEWVSILQAEHDFMLASFLVNLQLYEGLHLALHLPKNTSVFLENKIFQTTTQDSTLLIALNTLIPYVKEASEIQISLYNKDGLNKAHAELITMKEAVGIEKDEDPIQLVSRNPKQTLRDAIIIVSAFFVIMFILLPIINSKKFQDYFNYSKYYMFRILDDRILKISTLSPENIYYIFFSVLIAALLVGNLLLLGGFELTNFAEIEVSSFSSFIVFFIKAVLIFGLWLLLHLLLIYLFSNLFRMPFAGVHFYLIVQHIYLHYFPLLIIIMLIYFNQSELPEFVVKSSMYLFWIFQLQRLFMNFFKILRLSGFTYLHLFLYFCPTEIIPFILGLKLMLF